MTGWFYLTHGIFLYFKKTFFSQELQKISLWFLSPIIHSWYRNYSSIKFSKLRFCYNCNFSGSLNSKIRFLGLVCVSECKTEKGKNLLSVQLKTSIMWPSQNFLLHNGTIMQTIKKEKFKLVWQSLPFLRCMNIVQIIRTLISKKSRRF